MINRRGLIGGIGLLLAAPAIVKAENLMKLSAPKTLYFTNDGAITVGLPGGGGYEVGDVIIFHTFAPNAEVRVEGRVVDITANSMTFVKQKNGLWT